MPLDEKVNISIPFRLDRAMRFVADSDDMEYPEEFIDHLYDHYVRQEEWVNPVKCFIKEYREKKGLTQKQLAQLIDTNEAHISRLELGRHLPSLPRAFKLAEVLGCRIEDLYKP